MTDIDTEVRQSQLQVVKDKRGKTMLESVIPISMGPVAVGVLVVGQGMEGGLMVPWWTRRR